jgi:hypothetical protein
MHRFIAGLVSLAVILPAAAETVHALDQVPGKLKSPEAKKFFSEQMEGKPAPDLLGTHLPSALSADAIAKLLVPLADKNEPHLVGAKPWGALPNAYVAIVCTGGEKPYSAKEPVCAKTIGDDKAPPLKVYVGVITLDGGAPKLVAAGPAACATDWRNSGFKHQPAAADDAENGTVQPDSFDQFDLARYKIAPDKTAFGLRGAWSESYSGGGANYTALCLFALGGNALHDVLSVPMSAYTNFAGDWHKDGTRDHDISDQSNVLVVSKQSTGGYFDLILKARKGKKQRVVKWSKADGAYRLFGR